MANNVTDIAAANSSEAFEHFSQKLRFETDCWDVRDALIRGNDDFVVLDVRGAELYVNGHVPGAINVPHSEITRSRMAEWPDDTLFVVYCAGPHCNGANKAAMNLAKLGRPVKEMIGGVAGWADEGFEFATGREARSLLRPVTEIVARAR